LSDFETPYQLLADAVLLLHALIVGFVLGGLLFIVIGGFKGWRWVDSLLFRSAHLGAIAFVVTQAWLGLRCPLTLLEMRLREKTAAATYTEGFIEHWVQRAIYYDAPPWVFVAGYSLFGLLVVASWWYFPPSRLRRRGQ